MKKVATVAALRQSRLSWVGETVAFVPTMGNLHEGHLTLVDRARQEADRVIASIFVNPTQFGPSEDFASYPRTLEADLEKLASRGCDLTFVPAQEELYPRGIDAFTTVDVPAVGTGLCDASRPGHFRGVASVVTRLLNAVSPDIAVFGQKDYQQLKTMERMVAELLLPVSLVAAPIAREPSGLAMSSRNGYLSDAQKQQAGTLYRTLKQIRDDLVEGDQSWSEQREVARSQLRQAGLEPEYLELRHPQTLELPTPGHAEAWVLLAAVRLGGTRLIDNLVLPTPVNVR